MLWTLLLTWLGVWVLITAIVWLCLGDESNVTVAGAMYFAAMMTTFLVATIGILASHGLGS